MLVGSDVANAEWVTVDKVRPEGASQDDVVVIQRNGSSVRRQRPVEHLDDHWMIGVELAAQLARLPLVKLVGATAIAVPDPIGMQAELLSNAGQSE